MEGQRFTAFAPKMIGDAIGLKREEPLEVEEGLKHAPASRITLENGLHVGFRRSHQRAVCIISITKDMAHLLGAHDRALELLSQMK